MQTAENVARWFLRHCVAKIEPDWFTNSRLNLMLFYAQGINLALRNQPLFDDEIVYWNGRPAIKPIYEKYLEFGVGFIADCDDYKETFTADEEKILRETYDIFGQFSTWRLAEIFIDDVQAMGTVPNDVIALEDMKNHFDKVYVEESDDD